MRQTMPRMVCPLNTTYVADHPTAANPSESSWATYCSPDDVVNGKSVGSCLGDEYSVNWMEDSETATEDKPLQKQFEDVKTLTKGSHVQQYGVLTLTAESIRN